MAHSADGLAPAQLVDAIDESIRAHAKAGVALQTADDVDYLGRSLSLAGQQLLNFGGCSYLGLEQRPELKDAVIEAVRRYGTQFSMSRVYMDSPLYKTLEGALATMTGGHALVTASTTLGHIAALPVLVRPGDAIVMDRFAHASLHTAVALLKGIPIAIVNHGRMEQVEQEVIRLAAQHERVWYLGDGLYSMEGDFAPLASLAELLQRHPQVRLYLDDAHSTSWLGRHGRGHVLDVLGGNERVIVALSLNKAFSAAGGALIFADRQERDRVRRCGGPLLFGGPVQPPLLAAAVASARLHLAPEFAGLQRELITRIERVNAKARELGIPLANHDVSPIFFVPCGPAERTYPIIRGLHERGVFVCLGAFPAVPHGRSGVRFTVSVHNTLDDVDHLLGALASELRFHGVVCEH